MKKYQIGIIGYGDFTKVMIEYLAPYADTIVSSRSHKSGDSGFGTSFAPISEVLSRDIIIPSIPAQFFEDFFTQNREFINPDALVVDVCSVKIKPLESLQRLLPETCQIIGTHPMFGPASIAKNRGIKGLRCVVCPVRIPTEKFNSIKQLLKNELMLEVLERTPEQHDREMAYVQGLSHYIGRVMGCMDIPESELATLAYDDLLDMKKIQGGDSWDLYTSIMMQNPYAAQVNKQFKEACKSLDEKLRSERE